MPLYQSKKFIQLAHDMSMQIKTANYLLGSESLPHVSICHFIMEETHIEMIWNQVQALAIPPLSLTFSTRRAKIYPPDMACDATQCSVSLIPNNIDVLMDIHIQVANIIQKPLNAAFADYDPHLTLFNSYDLESCEQLNNSPYIIPSLDDTFTMTLGNIDNSGQVTNVLYTAVR